MPVSNTAESGTASALPSDRVEAISTRVYIDGFSKPPGFGNSIRTLAVRVSAVTVGYMKVTVPVSTLSG